MDEEKRTREQSPTLTDMQSVQSSWAPHGDDLHAGLNVLLWPPWNLKQRAPYFHFAPGLTNDVASSARDTSKLRGLVEEEPLSKRTHQEWPTKQEKTREYGLKEALTLPQGGNGWVCPTLWSSGLRREQRIHPGLAKVQVISDVGGNLLGGVACTNA